MADVQLENGGVAVAHDLFLAIAAGGFTTLQRGVIDGVLYFTYGAGKTKSQISTEDIRYLLGADKKLRTDRLDIAITELLARRVLFRQELINGKQLLALQKDYDQWNDKMSLTLQGLLLNSNTKNPIRVGDKMSHGLPEKQSPPERLLDYVQLKSKFTYSVPKWRIERKYAKQLYVEALGRTKSGDEAYQLITDFIDTDDWMREHVRMQFTYMSSRFAKWAAQIPRKPREIRENEVALGKRYVFDTKLNNGLGQWMVSDGSNN